MLHIEEMKWNERHGRGSEFALFEHLWKELVEAGKFSEEKVAAYEPLEESPEQLRSSNDSKRVSQPPLRVTAWLSLRCAAQIG